MFCCSKLSEAVFQGQSSKRFRSDSSGGIDDGFIGWACALAAQKIVFCGFQRYNVKEFFGSGFGRFRLVSRWCLGLFASKATACVLLFEAFGSGVPRPDFARPKRLFFVDSKGNVKEFFGSGFGRFRLVSRWCLGLFASKATACVLLLEAFGSGVPRPDFATVLQRVLEDLTMGL